MKTSRLSSPKWIIISAIVSTVFLTSCYKDKDFDFDKMAGNKYESEWAIPVINKKYYLNDLIADTMSYVVQDNNTFLTVIHYTGDLWTSKAEDIFILNDQNDSYSANSVAPTTPPSGAYYELDFSNSITLDFGSINDIDSILFKSGMFQAIVNTNINHNCELIISFPDVVNELTGQNLSFNLAMPYDGVGNFASGSTNISLANYKMRLLTSNSLPVNYKIKVYNDGRPFDIPNYSFSINTNFNDLKFKYMFGYFGQLTNNLTDTISIKLFRNNYENSITLRELKAHLFMKNSFGAPLEFTVNNFLIFTGGQSRNVINPGYQVAGPYPTLSQFGQTISKHDTTYLNPNVLEISPKYMAFNADGVINPQNNPSIRNFVTDKSQYSIDARLELPMEGKIHYFTFIDTLEFFFENIDQIEYTNFRVYIENTFPIDAEMQIYFADTAHVILDSMLVSRSIIPSGVVGPAPAYYTTAPGIKSLSILFNKQRLSRLSSTKWLIVYARLNSYNNGSTFIKLYGNQSVYISVGTRVKINADY